MKKLFYVTMGVLLLSCSSDDTPSVVKEDPIIENSPVEDPMDYSKLKGKLIYHSYSNYEALDSEMFMFDFATKELVNISKNWTGFKHAMNAHFSPSGKEIVFMAIDDQNDSWDLYLYNLETKQNPVNLTNSSGIRDEDPKYSYDGKKVVFKRAGKIAIMTLADKSIEIHNEADLEEYSMQYFHPSDNKLVCSGGDRQNSFIAVYDLVTKEMKKLYDRENVSEYYPIGIDNDTFYYSANVSDQNKHDNVYKGFWDGSPSILLKFNTQDADYSDACVIGNKKIFISSTKKDEQYDLYFTHEESGEVINLNVLNPKINHPTNWDLGATYFEAK